MGKGGGDGSKLAKEDRRIAELSGYIGQWMTTRVIEMRRNNTTNDKQVRRETKPTMAEVSEAIEMQRLPYKRVGDQYVLRQSDVRKLRTHREIGPERASKHETLEFGRTA